jgi:predicted DNA binding CopG/RHH family protein
MTDKRRKPVPRFASEAEEADYWAAHDLTEHYDLTRAQPAVFPNLRPSTQSISLRLPSALLADLKVLANRMDVPYQSLLKTYLAERVHQEIRRDRDPAELAAMVREPTAHYGVAAPGAHRRRTLPRPARSRRTR